MDALPGLYAPAQLCTPGGRRRERGLNAFPFSFREKVPEGRMRVRQAAYAALPRGLANAQPGWPGRAIRSCERFAMDGCGNFDRRSE